MFLSREKKQKKSLVRFLFLSYFDFILVFVVSYGHD
jgi:hypothetical protein